MRANHSRAVCEQQELPPEATLTGSPRGSRQVKHNTKLYNLKMILAVGYRVRSPPGAQFRRRATTALEEPTCSSSPIPTILTSTYTVAYMRN